MLITGLASAAVFPPGFRPCFASKGGYLLVAGSPGTIARFDPPTKPPTDAGEVPVLGISVAASAELPEAHREGLTEYLAKVNNADVAGLNPKLTDSFRCSKDSTASRWSSATARPGEPRGSAQRDSQVTRFLALLIS